MVQPRGNRRVIAPVDLVGLHIPAVGVSGERGNLACERFVSAIDAQLNRIRVKGVVSERYRGANLLGARGSRRDGKRDGRLAAGVEKRGRKTCAFGRDLGPEGIRLALCCG